LHAYGITPESGRTILGKTPSARTWRLVSSVCSDAERYLNPAADVFDLGRHIQFDTRVTAAHYREDTRSRGIVLEDGSRCTKIVIQLGRRF
jgi:hypothetical protein